MVFQKNTKTGIFKFLTCQKPHTLSSYPIIASKNDKHVRPYLSELTITHFHPTSTFGKRKGQRTRLLFTGFPFSFSIAARSTNLDPKASVRWGLVTVSTNATGARPSKLHVFIFHPCGEERAAAMGEWQKKHARGGVETACTCPVTEHTRQGV